MTPQNDVPAIPIGEFVAHEWNGRRLLGEIVAIEHGVATVKHFNGEPWPVRPLVVDLEWIRQDGAQ